MISTKRKTGIILFLAILLMPLPIAAEVYLVQSENLTREEITIKESEGWNLDLIYPGHPSVWWGTEEHTGGE